MHGVDLTKGAIGKHLWKLSWPMMLSMFFHTFYNLVDAFWVAKISPAAIAAVSISQISLFVMISLAMGLSVGSSVLMGMSMGAGDKDEAERVLGQGYTLSIVAAVFFTVLAFVFREQFLTLSGAIGDIFPMALSYFSITSLGSVLMFMMMNTSTAFNAQGDNLTATKYFAVSTLMNVVLDPLLIFGFGSFGGFGVAGAAYATLISQFVFLALAMRMLMSDGMMIRFKLKNLGLKWDSVKRVFQIGIPASLTQTLNPLSFLFLIALVSGAFFEAGAAAFSIGFRIEFFAFIPAVGFGFGAMAMMGQNLGAKNFERLKEIIVTAIKYGAGAALGFSVLVWLGAPYIVGAFTDDPLVTEYALAYFRIVPLGYPCFAIAFIETSLFQGFGRSWPGFWITFGRVALVIGIAYLSVISWSMGINAVWFALMIGSIVASVIGFVWIWKVINNEIEKSSNL
jgi:putative MATE family efflux protein